jgi:DnaK suppressor protein
VLAVAEGARVTVASLRSKEVSLNVNEFRKLLEARRKELLSNVSDREEIRIENAAEDFDRLQQQLNREVAIRNLDRESKLLKNVQSALARIEEGTFGICLRCDEEIPERRLKALPWAAYCVACQEVVDRQIATGNFEGDGDDMGELAA